ncbi:unnamed protein product [Rhizoctonia solani]|uniref:Cystathionine gamma-synthase n=1 Tax=Rhizoctonia solani TaxID=456999 RepID=A0A8H3GS29_9AGAM|nr:unnamed protein product [Rhizoctonia solani]
MIKISNELGIPIPNLPHAISVSLPTWDDNVGYVSGDKRVVDAMATGYPRFVIHRDVQALARIYEKNFGRPGEKCLLFPTAFTANAFRQFMINRSPDPASPVLVRLVENVICPTGATPNNSNDCVELHVGFFPEEALLLGKQFWQHTGLGISSRLARAALDLIARNETASLAASPVTSPRIFEYNNHSKAEHVGSEHNTHNLPKANAALAKATLRRRIAGLLVNDFLPVALPDNIPELGTSKCGVNVTDDDVFLFPTGMAAIWNSYQLLLALRPQRKSICFGFPYTDTLKILQKWGPGCHFFARAQDAEIDQLSLILQTESISVLYTESPTNPLLQSVNLPRLRALANKYDFLIVVDETIGSFVNVQVLPYADIVITSLSKFFSGEANVTGGSLVLNPAGRHYQTLKSQLQCMYEDTYWGPDAIVMEHNSRNFIPRVHTINQNAEVLSEFLRNRSLSGPSPAPNMVIKQVYYPKWETRANYDASKRASHLSGFSGLFSLTFTTMAASRAFFDNLDCAKGPSLGTSFTLVCPYTILAHFAELDWAEVYGVDTGLVRVSVGLEELEELLSKFTVALEKAEATAYQMR